MCWMWTISMTAKKFPLGISNNGVLNIYMNYPMPRYVENEKIYTKKCNSSAITPSRTPVLSEPVNMFQHSLFPAFRTRYCTSGLPPIFSPCSVGFRVKCEWVCKSTKTWDNPDLMQGVVDARKCSVIIPYAINLETAVRNWASKSRLPSSPV